MSHNGRHFRGIFEDSLPDSYGRFLLNRLLKKQGIDEEELTPLQRLSIVGSAGMGALCYEHATTIAARTHRRIVKHARPILSARYKKLA